MISGGNVIGWPADNALSLASQKQLMSGSNVIGRPTP
jgi:hypothetical protein